MTSSTHCHLHGDKQKRRPSPCLSQGLWLKFKATDSSQLMPAMLLCSLSPRAAARTIPSSSLATAGVMGTPTACVQRNCSACWVFIPTHPPFPDPELGFDGLVKQKHPNLPSNKVSRGTELKPISHLLASLRHGLVRENKLQAGDESRAISKQEYQSKTCLPERCFLPSCFAAAPLSPSQAPVVGHSAQPGCSFWPGLCELRFVPCPCRQHQAASLECCREKSSSWTCHGELCSQTEPQGTGEYP